MTNRFLESGELYSFLSLRHPRNIEVQQPTVQLRPTVIPINHRKLQNYQNVGVDVSARMFESKDVYAPPFLNIAPVLQNTGMTQYSRAPVIRRDRLI